MADQNSSRRSKRGVPQLVSNRNEFPSTDDDTIQPIEEIDFHFDVLCPWAYQTSLWVREAREQFGFKINWKFFSLEEVNREEGKKHPWERPWSYGWSQLRICAYLRRIEEESVDSYYLRSGKALHEEGRKAHTVEVARELLGEIGMDPNIVDLAIADPSTNDEVLADHQRVLSYGGFGVPTMVVRNKAIFGPVVTPAPTGEEAKDLWRLVDLWSRFDHLYEMRRPKTDSDLKHIADSFDPYLKARDWRTIQNDAP
ncbi:MAG: hypothetical protein HKL83_06280 [Acidimicrobiaceae bacterium]|nr:hypothetical protein [Acidimicrobiaceae bacterium]